MNEGIREKVEIVVIVKKRRSLLPDFGIRGEDL